MEHVPRLGYWLRVVGLPVLLLLLVTLGLGSHYETNDDFSISLLLRGRTAAAPVSDLHLYFHGWAALLARLYLLWPALPWYGLTLYALLLLALGLLTAVLEELLRPHTTAGQRTAALAVFLLLAGAEHLQWFNYVRVPLLLAGAAVLRTAQRRSAGRRGGLLGLLLFAAAWAIRPSAAVLGLLTVAPAAWWLGGRGGWRVVAAAGALAGLLGLVVQLTRTPEAARYRRLDVLKSEVLDFGWYEPAPRTRADSLGVALVEEWTFGDSTRVNEALFRRAYQPAPLVETAKRKADQLTQLGRDYFPLLLLQALLLMAGRQLPGRARRWQLLYVLGLGLLLSGLALVLKVPPRLAGPLLTLSSLGHLALVSNGPQRLRLGRVSYGLLALATGLYGLKIEHRYQVLTREQQLSESYLKPLLDCPAGTRVVVGVGTQFAFKSLSPFRQYVPAAGPPWLLVTGWPTLDPSQARLRRLLTGSRDQATALYRLSRRPDVHWVIPGELPQFRAVWHTYQQPRRDQAE